MSRDLNEVKGRGAALQMAMGRLFEAGGIASKCQGPEEVGVDVMSREDSKEVNWIGMEGDRESRKGWNRELWDTRLCRAFSAL